jgi:hypothetical protein
MSEETGAQRIKVQISEAEQTVRIELPSGAAEVITRGEAWHLARRLDLAVRKTYHHNKIGD